MTLLSLLKSQVRRQAFLPEIKVVSSPPDNSERKLTEPKLLHQDWLQQSILARFAPQLCPSGLTVLKVLLPV